jgi:hypothetical protein
MTYLSRGNDRDLEEARKLLEELAKEKKKTNRDFLITPVVGTDPFLIAISPQDENEYAKLAEEMIKGQYPTLINYSLETITPDENDPFISKTDDIIVLITGLKYKLSILVKDINLNELSENFHYKLKITPEKFNGEFEIEKSFFSKIKISVIPISTIPTKNKTSINTWRNWFRR